MKIAGNTIDLADVAAVAAAIVAAVFGFLAWRKAGEANRIAAASNSIAQDSRTLAEASNRIATGANVLASEANDIARDANRVVTYDIEYRRELDLKSKRAILEIPSVNPIGMYTTKGPYAVLSVSVVNKGAGDVRNLEMTVFDNGEQIWVEQGKIRRLTRDDSPDPSRLQFLIYYDSDWQQSPESHLIRAHFDYEDGTGHREDDHCFRFSEAGRPNWISTKVLCE